MKRMTFALLTILIVLFTTVIVYSADAAGIPKKAISTVATFLKTDLPATTVFTDQLNTFTARNIFSSQSVINGTFTTFVSKTSNYNALLTDDTINVDATNANPTTITLPSATTSVGKLYTISKKDLTTNPVAVTASAGNVGGNATRFLISASDSITVQSDGTNWVMIDGNMASGINSFMIKGSSKNRYFDEAVAPDAHTSTIAVTANVLRAYPMVIAKTISIDSIQYEVTTLAAGSCRVGIYTDNGTQYPDNLVSNTDIGIRAVSTVGMKTNATASAVTLLGNSLYWVAYDCNITPTLRGMLVTSIANVLGYGTATGGSQQGTGWTVASAFGALPSKYPAGGTILVNSVPPSIMVRIKG
jgi:hypothetical protein